MKCHSVFLGELWLVSRLKKCQAHVEPDHAGEAPGSARVCLCVGTCGNVVVAQGRSHLRRGVVHWGSEAGSADSSC